MIAVISGKGNLPKQACSSLLQANKNFFVISLFPEDNSSQIKEIIQNKAEILEQKFYKTNKILKILKEKKTKEILFIGKVDKRNLLKHLKLDWLAIKLLAQLTYKNDKDIMEILVQHLHKEGFKVLKQSDILQPLLIKPAVLTGKLDEKLKKNINFGMQKAEQLSLCDIGQTVIVKDLMLIAVEAIEGTDECIRRGIELGKKNIIICKTAHKNQNKKYDLPTLGAQTLKYVKTGQIKAIAWQSDKTFISEKEDFINKAKELNITLVSI